MLTSASMGELRPPLKGPGVHKVVPFGGHIPAWGVNDGSIGGGKTPAERAAEERAAKMGVEKASFGSPTIGRSSLGTPTGMTRADSRPSTVPGDLPSLGGKASSSPYDEERKLQREVKQLRKRVHELEFELKETRVAKKGIPFDPAERRKQMESAYGVSGAMSAGLPAGVFPHAIVAKPSEPPPPPLADEAVLSSRLAEARVEWETKLAALQAECERKVSHSDRDRHAARLEAQLAVDKAKADMSSLNVALEQSKAQHAKKERQARVELLRRQSLRRMTNAGLASGWGAWLALYQAKTYALKRLREAANRLRVGGLSSAFYDWKRIFENTQVAAAVKETALKRQSLATQLEHAKKEVAEIGAVRRGLTERVRELSSVLAEKEAVITSQADEITRGQRYLEGQLDLLRVAHKDEMRGLVEKTRELTAAIKKSEAEVINLRRQLPSGKVQEDARSALEAAEAAERRVAETEAYSLKQVAANKALLESLLEKQRKAFEEQMKGCTCAHAAKREAELQAQFEKAKAERVELMGKQSVRRMMNAALADAWTGWHDFWSAKTYAMGRLRQAANRLRAPEIAHTFGHWVKRLEATRRARLQKEVDSKLSLLTEEGRRIANLETELALARGQLADAAKQRRALAEQVSALDGGLALESLRLEEQQKREKEERVELLRRQSVRRMVHAGLAGAWQAWLELYEAKTYAKKRLQQAASRLKAPELARTFQWWVQWRQAKLAKVEMMAARAAEAAALEERQDLAMAYEAMRAELEGKLALAEQQKAELRKALAEVDGGTSQMQALLDAREAEEKERRVELYRRQVAKRILNQGLTRGFTAWLVMAQARAHAYARLAKAGKRFKAPQLAEAFGGWAALCEAIRQHREKQALAKQLREEAGLREGAISHSEILEKKVAEYERRLAAAEHEKEAALKRQLIELTGSAEDVLRMHEEREKEERIELMRRQAGRRILFADLARGLGAWLEFWRAKTYAVKRLRECANRLKSPESALKWEAFAFWATTAARERVQQQRRDHMRRESGLTNETQGLAQQLKETVAKYERLLAEAESEKYRALEAQEVELTGSAEQVLEMRSKREKEERVELLRRQSVRRMIHAGLNGAWQAWLELYEAKTYAMGRLQQAASRLKAPELADTFHWWARSIEIEREAAEFKRLHRREKQLATGVSAAQEAVQRAVEQGARQVAAVREEMRVALARQLTELTGTTEEVLKMREERDKEARIEMLHRQALRRMLHAGIAAGFAAWLELADAKRYAISRLREVGNRLRAPAKAESFGWWVQLVEARKRAAELARLEAETHSVEAQLRRSKHERHQLEMMKALQDDEMRALRAKVDDLEGAVAASTTGAVSVDDLSAQLELVRAREAEAHAEAAEAERRCAEAEAAHEQQRSESQQLMEKLLAEQRRKLEGSWQQMQRQSREAESAQRQALQAELDRYRDDAKAAKEEVRRAKSDGAAKAGDIQAQLERLRSEASAERRGLQEEIAQLKIQLQAALEQAAPAPSPKPPAVSNVLGNLNLDEGPDAPPFSQQIGDALRKNAVRVIDLFRSWDTDGDGEVTRKEFHEAMPRLGLDVPKESIDELFDEWDKDGGGAINLNELRRILSQHRAASPTTKTEKAVTATKALSKLSKK